MKSNRFLSRKAALLYLGMAILSAFSIMYVDPQLYVPGNAQATAEHIHASEFLLRIGLLCNLAGQTLFIFLAFTLYQLLQPVNKNMARLLVGFVIASVPITFLNMLNLFAPVLLLHANTAAFNPEQLQTLVMLFMDLHHHGIYIVEVFWGLWLFPFGWLVYKSAFLPKWIGGLLMAGCFGYLIECVVMFVDPGYKVITYPGIAISSVAEISFIIWALAKGARNVPQKAL
jgi:hypothetical protein